MAQAANISKWEDMIFDNEACTRCGDCFHFCPELQLPRELAIREIKSLRTGFDGKYVLQYCLTCFTCNTICKNNAEPYQLILKNWNRKYRDRGAPPIYRFICPTMENSIFQMLEPLMTQQERDLTNRWMNQEPGETVLLIGNYTHLFPLILGESRLLDHFTPIDLLDHWEAGATLYQGGYLDVVRQIGWKCRGEFDRWQVKTVVPLLDAVEHMLSKALPKEMGIKFRQNIVNFNDWLLQRLEDNTISLKHPLKMKVTLHDNCFAKAGGNRYFDNARKIVSATGCEIREMQHTRSDSLCCGFGAGASWERNIHIPFDILASGKKKIAEAESTGAEALVTYCGGCLYLLWAAKELFRSKLKVYHHVELVRMAMGETIEQEQEGHIRRAWDVIAIITYHLLTGISKRPFWIEELSLKEDKWEYKKYPLFRILRRFLDTRIGRCMYRRGFLLLLPLLKRNHPVFPVKPQQSTSN